MKTWKDIKENVRLTLIENDPLYAKMQKLKDDTPGVLSDDAWDSIMRKVLNNTFHIAKARTMLMQMSDLPIVFDNGDILAYDHGHIKLITDGIISKNLPCRAEDRIKFKKRTFYIIRLPKEKWRKILWKVGLTKGNWRHPTMIKTEHCATHAKINGIDDKENILIFIELWVMKNGFRFWYCPFGKSGCDLETLARTMVDMIKTHDIFNSSEQIHAVVHEIEMDIPNKK